MKICLVSSFPPSRRGLNEYGFHLARELQRNPLLSVTVLADDLGTQEPEIPGFSVVRCWDFNCLTNPIRLLREIRKLQPDVVWFNIGFASYGNKALPAAVGLMMPALVRLAGFQTHVTLHQLMDTVDLNDAGVRFRRLYKMAGAVITRILLLSDSVSVLLPAYRVILQEKYRSGSVYVRPHGILSGRPEYPDFSRRGKPMHRVLAFGKWGTYKRLEPLIEAFLLIADDLPSVRLVVGGGNHPNAPGYVESIAQRYQEDSRIEFTGYVPEEKLADLFRSATVTVMPYSSSAGSSGVAHLASQYGVPIVASDIPDFRQLAEEEGLAIEFFKTGSVPSMARSLRRILESSELQQEMAVQNFSVALHMTMPRVIRDYLRTFDLTERVEALRSISRLRRLPRWMPLRSTAGRFLLRNWAGWRAWLPSPHILQHDPYDSVNGNGAGATDSVLAGVNGNGGARAGMRSGNGIQAHALPSLIAADMAETGGHDHRQNGNSGAVPNVQPDNNNSQHSTRSNDAGGEKPISEVLRLMSSKTRVNRNGDNVENKAADFHESTLERTNQSKDKAKTQDKDRADKSFGLQHDRDVDAA
ncbi:MAG TPA: glycosyltransferase [Terriglobales bacterium]|nr:glycosyltransferase [Terriglobales bacterium]